MFNKKSINFLFIVFLFGGLLSSCYQKKGQKNEKLISTYEDNFPDDTLISGIDTDSVVLIDTFELMPTSIIFSKIQGNSKKKKVYKLPVLKATDSLENYEFIEQIALTNIYTSIGKLSSNTKLYQTSLAENQELFSKIIEDSIEFPIKASVDSLNKWTEQTLIEQTSQNEWVYYEAIQWLENLYLTIESPTNSKNAKKLEELVALQLDNGTEMLERLSLYQDYQPIVNYSNYLIDILDCKYFTFDVTQLKNEVIKAREDLYIQKRN